MDEVIGWAIWALAVTAIMASPIALMLVVPTAVGIAFEVADLRSERMLVLLLWAPIGLMFVRRLACQLPPRHPVAA